MTRTTPASSLGAGAVDRSQYQELDQGIYRVLNETPARLFLGTQKAAQNRQLLRKHGVSRIVCVGTPAFHRDTTVGGEGPLGGRDDEGDSSTSSNNNGSEFAYLEVPVLDLPSENLLGRLDECTSFIEDGMRRGQGVFVNCVFAQSRSAAVVAAYLMKHKAMPYLQAVDEVRKAQPTVHINPGFEAQLALYRDMGCRLPPGTRKHPKEGEEPPAGGTSEALTAMENRGGGPTNFRADATYRWFLFANGVKNDDQGGLQRLPSLNSGGEGFWRAGSSSGGGGPGLMRKGCGGGAAAAVAAAAAYRCRACRASLFSETNVVDHRHPVVQAASDSVYASFSRHGGDGSSWLAARDAAAAAAASASGSSSSSTFGARAPASKTPRGGGKGAVPSRRVRSGGGDEISGGRVSTVGLASSRGGEERGCCTSVFTEVLGWVEISEVCRGAVGLGPRQKFGKILCPGKKGRRGGAETLCQSKLGSWSLDGAACSCGRTVKPALQFTLSRIERVG